MRTTASSPRGFTSTVTRASPMGHPRARITIRCGDVYCSTTVRSFTSSGHTPTEWCSSAPAIGHLPSTSRMRAAPTTQAGYSHPSLSTAKTSSGAQCSTLTLLDIVPLLGRQDPAVADPSLHVQAVLNHPGGLLDRIGKLRGAVHPRVRVGDRWHGRAALGLGKVRELPVAVRRRTVRPRPLPGELPVGEVDVLIGGIRVLLPLWEIARHRKVLDTLLLKLSRCRDPLILMHRVAREEEREKIADSGIVGHVVQTCHLQPALHLRIRVGGEVGEQVPARRDVAPGPWFPHAVDRPCPRPCD